MASLVKVFACTLVFLAWLLHLNLLSPVLLIFIAGIAWLVELVYSWANPQEEENNHAFTRQMSGESRPSHAIRKSNSSGSRQRSKTYKFGDPNIDCSPLWASEEEMNWFVAAVAEIHDVTYFSMDAKVSFNQKPQCKLEKRQKIKDAIMQLRDDFEEDASDAGSSCEPIDDILLCRILVATDFDVAKCQKWMHRYRVWRREVHGIVVPPAAWLNIGFMFTPFLDYLGRPVLIVKARWFQKDIALPVIEAGIRATVDVVIAQQLQKRGERISKRNPLEQYVLVFEAEGAGFNNFSLPVIKLMLGESDAHYPDRLAQCFILRCNQTVKAIWSIVAPLLHVRTRRKVKLVAPGDVASVMQQLVPSDQLPPMYGGSAPSWPVPADAVNMEDKAGKVAAQTWEGLGMQLEEQQSARIRVERLAGQTQEWKVWLERSKTSSSSSRGPERRTTTPKLRSAFVREMEGEEPSSTQCSSSCFTGIFARVPSEVRSPESFEQYLNRVFVSDALSRQKVLEFIQGPHFHIGERKTE